MRSADPVAAGDGDRSAGDDAEADAGPGAEALGAEPDGPPGADPPEHAMTMSVASPRIPRHLTLLA